MVVLNGRCTEDKLFDEYSALLTCTNHQTLAKVDPGITDKSLCWLIFTSNV